MSFNHTAAYITLVNNNKFVEEGMNRSCCY